MASVGTPVKTLDRAQEDGRRYVMVRFPCLDHDSGPRDVDRGPILVDSGFDVTAWANDYKDTILEDLAQEDERAALDTENGVDPLIRTQNPLWATEKRLALVLLRTMLAENDPRFTFYIESLWAYVRTKGTSPGTRATWLGVTTARFLKMKRRVDAATSDIGTMRALLVDFDLEQENT